MALSRLQVFVRNFLISLGLCLCVALPARAYDVAISGLSDEALLETVRAISVSWAGKDEENVRRSVLYQRMERDRGAFADLLASEGYYGATIDARLTKTGIAFDLTPGPRFTYGKTEIRFDGPVPEHFSFDFTAHGIKPGAPARAGPVNKARGAFEEALADLGYYGAAYPCRDQLADHRTKTLVLVWCVNPGPVHHIRGLTVKGSEDVKSDYVLTVANIEEGAVLTPELLTLATRRLAQSGLFKTIAFEPRVTNPATGDTMLDIVLDDDHHRTVSLGARYSTSEGAGVTAAWTHRNFFGRGERLTIEATALQLLQGLTLDFAKPAFMTRTRTLTFATGFEREDTDAFKTERFEIGSGVEQIFNEDTTLSLGLTFETQKEERDEGDTRLTLLTLTGGVIYDGRDHVLDPTSGVRLSLTVAPSWGVIHSDGQFVRVRGSASAYQKFHLLTDHVLAGRINLGSLLGADRVNIPSDRLFYAGGGGSIRGFDYQSVGPEDAEGDPAGGRSLIETAVELRSQITDDIGLVGFLDGGAVNPTLAPFPPDEFRFGTGLGVRYKTPAGPIRLDLATPLDRRDSEPIIQVYISIGQPF